mgnify:CR=1 FL=1
MPGPQLTGKHLLSGLCCGPDMSGPYCVTMANGSCGGVKPHLSAVYLPIAAHFSFSQTFSSSFRRGLSIS